MNKDVSQYSEERPKIEMLACQYLWGSADCLIQAISDYNNPKIGSVERSFNEVHRAWNALWIADAKASNPSWSIIDKRNPKFTRGIESHIVKYKKDLKSDTDFIEQNLSQTFQKMRNVNEPLRASFNLIYQLRNIMEHDFVEFSGSLYADTVTLLNPYMNANLLNYIQTYNEVYDKVLHICATRHTASEKRNGLCVYRKLLPASEIILGISLPSPMKEEKPYRDIYNAATYRKIQSRRKTLRNYLNPIIEEAKSNIPKTDRNDTAFIQNILGPGIPSKKHSADRLQEEAQSMIDSYKYKSLSDIAKNILISSSDTVPTASEIASLRNRCQTIKDKLVKRLSEDHPNNWEEHTNLFWRTFWESKNPRYSEDFYRYLSNKLKDTSEI